MFTVGTAFQKPRRPFIISVKTDNSGTSNNDQFTLPTVSGGDYDFYIKTSEGVSARVTTYNDSSITTTFSGGAGTYDIEIHGKFDGFAFNNGADRLKLLEVKQWGSEFRLGTSQNGHFYGCSNLTITATDILDISQETNLGSTFRACSSLTTIPSINDWNFSNVEILNNTFRDSTFNQVIDSWNLDSCTELIGFLRNNDSFNSSVTMRTPVLERCERVFQDTAIFNSAIDLDTSTVTSFAYMFINAIAFNQPVTNIDTSSATSLLRMFDNCDVFNQSVDHFEVSNVTAFNGMFWRASQFNQPFPSWTTSSLVSLTNFVQLASSFDQDISHFDVSSMVAASNMALNSGFSQTNYDKLLNTTTGWPSQSLQSGVTAHFGSAQYGAGDPAAGRAILTGSPNNWTITDGGPA